MQSPSPWANAEQLHHPGNRKDSTPPFPSNPPRPEENHGRVRRHKRILNFEEIVQESILDLFRRLFRVSGSTPPIPLQQLLHLPHLRRPNRIKYRRPHGRHRNQPTHRWPKRMRQQTKQLLLDAMLVENAACSADSDGGDGEENVQEVQASGVVPEDNFEAAEEGGSEAGIAFLEFGGEGAGGFEGGSTAA